MKPTANSSPNIAGHKSIGSPGSVEKLNRLLEDRFECEKFTTKGGLSIALGIIADGIGGENSGEIAARITAEGVLKSFKDSYDTNIPEMLRTALVKVNADVFKESQQQAHKKNMGSTAAVAAIHDNRLFVANVGDSRIYLVRDNKIIQLTVDHTWEHEVVKAGKLSRVEAARHPRSGELMRSIGYKSTVEVDLGLYLEGTKMSDAQAVQAQGLPLKLGDVVVICSDGLIKSRPGGKGHFVELHEIVKIVTTTPFNEAPNQLVQKALDRYVDDNVSVIVMEIPGGRKPLRLPRFALPVAAAVLALAIVVLTFLPRILNPLPPPPLPLPNISGNQIYISQVWNTTLQVRSLDNTIIKLSDDTLLDFKSGETFSTTGSGNGYASIGFPGQVELYLSDGTEIFTKDPGDALTKINIVLNRGRLLVKLPSTFLTGQRFLVETPNGSQAWINGSMMGLEYDPLKHQLYFDCLEDICGYLNNGLNQFLPQGSFVVLDGGQVMSSGLGTQNELWQFIPDLVPTSTPTPSATPNAAATQACKYLRSLGTPCPP